MIVKPNDWTPQFFQQKGWIASKFKINNANNGTLRWKKRNQTQTNLNPISHNATGIQKSQNQSAEMRKPSTAPHHGRNRVQIVQNLQKMGAASSIWQEAPPINQSRYSNFRTTVNNRKQLLYIKPYTRYQNNSKTIDQKKMQIYKEINNPDLSCYLDSFDKSANVIEYLTQYKDPFSNRPLEESKNKQKSSKSNRTSLNVLREKLKRKCEPSSYKSKINAIKFQ